MDIQYESNIKLSGKSFCWKRNKTLRFAFIVNKFRDKVWQTAPWTWQRLPIKCKRACVCDYGAFKKNKYFPRFFTTGNSFIKVQSNLILFACLFESPQVSANIQNASKFQWILVRLSKSQQVSASLSKSEQVSASLSKSQQVSASLSKSKLVSASLSGSQRVSVSFNCLQSYELHRIKLTKLIWANKVNLKWSSYFPNF